MSKQLLLIFLLIPYTLFGQLSNSKREVLLMGSRFELVAIHKNKALCDKAISAAIQEIERVERMISSWKPDSETSRINKNAGLNPVQVSEELFNLIERSKKISVLTNGAFDISFASINPFWTFDGRKMKAPDSSKILASVHKINYQNIILDRNALTVFLKEKGMQIGFGAIGKGYAANKAMQTMKQLQIMDGLINAGGDLITWGKDEQGEIWQIGIADPAKEKEYIAWLNISNMSVVTSGNYEKFVIIDSEKYGHIINPKTGYPVRGIKSVTLVSPDAELSDALATSVFVLGIEDGIDLVNSLKNIECLIIDDNNKLWPSQHLELNYY